MLTEFQSLVTTHTVNTDDGTSHFVGIYKVWGAYLIVTERRAWFKFTHKGAVSAYTDWLESIGH